MSTPSLQAEHQRPGVIRLSLFGRTDVGQIREHNEDNFLIADLTSRKRGLLDTECVVSARGYVFAVCDGMGGAAAGEVASQLAVDLVYQALADAPSSEDHDALAFSLVRAIEEAGRKIYHEARADRTRRGMGTTATVAALMDERLFLGQVGDSRGYILRDGVLTQVTRDQSLVNQLIEAGQLSQDEAETFEHNNIILQALGTAEGVQVDLTYVDLRADDILLLCSDGLSGMIRDAEIKDILQHMRDPESACRELIERANAAGGHDNTTVIVVRFDGDGVRATSQQDAPVTYQKYPLPARPSSNDEETERRSSLEPPSSEDPGLSEEAANEARPLRVTHTLFGSSEDASKVKATGRRNRSAAPPKPGARPKRQRDEPVSVPITGMAPQVVGAIVVFSLLLLAAMGVVLLR